MMLEQGEDWGNKDLACDHCDYKTRSSIFLKRHNDSIHNENLIKEGSETNEIDEKYMCWMRTEIQQGEHFQEAHENNAWERNFHRVTILSY